MSAEVYALYLALRELGDRQEGDWPGSDVVDIVDQWLIGLGLETDSGKPVTPFSWVADQTSQ